MKRPQTNITIDAAKCKPDQDCLTLEWSGWSIKPCLGGAKPYVLVNGERRGSCEASFSPRPDVTAQFPKLSAQALHGFCIRWRIPWAEISLQDRVELAVPQENALSPMVWSSVKQPLEQLMAAQALQLSIDEKHLDEQRITVCGWCISPFGKDVTITLKDSQGSLCSFEQKKIARLDVSSLLFGDESHKDCGFCISFPYREAEQYVLTFSNRLKSQAVSLDPARIKKETIKEEKRHYMPLDEIKRSTGKAQLRRDCRLLFQQGPRALKKEWLRRYAKPTYVYEKWFADHQPSERELKQQRRKTFASMPKISIIVPAFQTPEHFLKQMIRSVQAQSYPNWELCIADGGVEDTVVASVMEQYCAADSRFRYQKLTANLGISGNTNAALALASGDFIALLDHDDLLAPNALYEVVKAINEQGADVLYSDEDKISMDLQHHFEPHFKPDLNWDLLRSNNYICHFFAASRSVLNQVGAFRSAFDGAQDFDMILRCAEQAKCVYHIPKVLYHWRMHQNSTAANPESKMYCYEAGKKAVEEHLQRQNIEAKAEMGEHLGYYRVVYPADTKKLLSVLLLGGTEAQQQCTRASLAPYDGAIAYEIIPVGQTEETGACTARQMNQALAQARGEQVLILNAGMTLPGDRLIRWLGECQRTDVGVVGVKICDKKDRVLSCGQILSRKGNLVTLFAGCGKNDAVYFARTKLQQDVTVLSLCGVMADKRDILAVGGWDEHLGKALADADLCLKLGKAGKRILLDACLTITAPSLPPQEQPGAAEKARFMERWKETVQSGDVCCYNVNLDDEQGMFQVLL